MLNNSNLYDSEWLALVFRNRNQAYGAYVLRTQSSNILLRSLMIAAPVFIMLFVGPMIYSQIKGKPLPLEREVVTELREAPIHEMKKELPKDKPEPKKAEKVAAPLQQQQVKTTAFTSKIELVNDPVVEPPTSLQIENTAIASVSQEGTAGSNAQPVGNTVGGTGTSTEGAVTGNEIIEVGGVEVFPEFPGGMEAWSKFIQKNLRYPYAAQDQGIQGKVYLSFVVEKDGSITDVKVIRGIGYGCDDEAVRVIKKSPKWKPGLQNKQNVRVRYQMPINYTISQ